MFQEVEKIIQEVFLEAAHGIMNEAASNMEVAEWKSNGNLEIKENGFIVSWDNLLLIFREFGTGRYSASYLSNKPQDIKDEAMKFFVNGLGTLPANPMIYPVVVRYSEWVPTEINKRVEEWFKNVKL